MGVHFWICSGQCGNGSAFLDLQWTVWQWECISGFALDTVAMGVYFCICSGQCGSLPGFAVDGVAVGQSLSVSPIKYFPCAPFSLLPNHPLYIAKQLSALLRHTSKIHK